ncbi:hypothetical protein TrLO_g15873 [Triparma laevis f. longispina]|uniref:Uncharacterized protein n=1 Tax=Triparma laevis f. longispina TaxID=1714387 RepID=A0A9W7EC09_9STRA|nr:hypothetical protein TrLO_g15873 [Triparma laevis f. longispina]
MINQDVAIPPPTGFISDSPLPPVPPSTNADADDLTLEDESEPNSQNQQQQPQREQTSLEKVIPVDKLKNGANTAFANLAWLGNQISVKANEVKSQIETNPQYQQTTHALNQKVSEVKQSEFAAAAHRHSVTAFNGVVSLGEKAAAGTMSAVETVKTESSKVIENTKPVLENVGEKIKPTFNVVAEKTKELGEKTKVACGLGGNETPSEGV